MNTHTHIVGIGSRGWQHPGWCDNYYPEDLPTDWRLDFYANDFRQLLLPYAALRDATPEDSRLWLEATDDDFRFFVEIPKPAVLPAVLLETLAALGGRLAGICVNDDTVKVTADLDPGLARPAGLVELAELAKLAPIYHQQPLDPIQPFTANQQWLPLTADSASPRLITVTATEGHDAMQLRACIEALQATGGRQPETLLFFDGKPPLLADMQLLQQLGELLCR